MHGSITYTIGCAQVIIGLHRPKPNRLGDTIGCESGSDEKKRGSHGERERLLSESAGCRVAHQPLREQGFDLWNSVVVSLDDCGDSFAVLLFAATFNRVRVDCALAAQGRRLVCAPLLEDVSSQRSGGSAHLAEQPLVWVKAELLALNLLNHQELIANDDTFLFGRCFLAERVQELLFNFNKPQIRVGELFGQLLLHHLTLLEPHHAVVNEEPKDPSLSWQRFAQE